MSIKTQHAYYGWLLGVHQTSPLESVWYYGDPDGSAFYQAQILRGKVGDVARFANISRYEFTAKVSDKALTFSGLLSVDQAKIRHQPALCQAAARILRKVVPKVYRTPLIAAIDPLQPEFSLLQRPPVLTDLAGDKRSWDFYQSWQQDYLLVQYMLQEGDRDAYPLLASRLAPAYLTAAAELDLISKRTALHDILMAHSQDAQCY